MQGPGRSDEIVRYMRLLVALPLLPPERMQEAVNCLQPALVVLNVEAERMAKLGRIHDYLQNYWMDRVGSAKLSVGLCPRRTNNDLESFHAKLLRKIQAAHPNMWTFLGKTDLLNRFMLAFI